MYILPFLFPWRTLTNILINFLFPWRTLTNILFQHPWAPDGSKLYKEGPGQKRNSKK